MLGSKDTSTPWRLAMATASKQAPRMDSFSSSSIPGRWRIWAWATTSSSRSPAENRLPTEFSR